MKKALITRGTKIHKSPHSMSNTYVKTTNVSKGGTRRTKYHEGTNYNDDTKLFEEMTRASVKCPKCGKSVMMRASRKKKLCRACGSWVKNTSKAHFDYEFYKAKNKLEKEIEENGKN